MSYGNRRIIGALAGLAALLVAFGSGAYLDALTEIGQQREAAQDASGQAREHPSPASDSSGAASPPTIDVPESARDQAYYDREDLKAQQEMATWTRRMGQAAIAGIILSLVGIWLIWQTWDATKKAAASSQETLRAYIAKERAVLRFAEYIHFKAGWNEPYKIQTPLATFNRGGGNAIVESLHYTAQKDGEWPTQFENNISSGAFIEPQSEGQAGWIRFKPPNGQCFFLLGFVEYSTVGDKLYRSHFCFMINPTDQTIADPVVYSGHMRKFPGTPRDT